MRNYLDALQYILDYGVDKSDRTGTGTRSVFGYQLRFNLNEGFPAVTTKKLAWKAVVSELLWFLEGSTDERRLCEILHGTRDKSKRTIWTDNAEAGYWKDRAAYDGDLGRVYAAQWRRWRDRGRGLDQITTLIEGIKKDPDSRRHLVVAYNPGELSLMALPPCHVMFQMNVTNGRLSCMMTQRSADGFLGIPFNIASYALLTHMIAQVCELEVGDLIISIGDFHIYHNHMSQVKELITRTPLPLPTLHLNPDIKSIFDFTMDDISLTDYQCHAAITAPMAI